MGCMASLSALGAWALSQALSLGHLPPLIGGVKCLKYKELPREYWNFGDSIPGHSVITTPP